MLTPLEGRQFQARKVDQSTFFPKNSLKSLPHIYCPFKKTGYDEIFSMADILIFILYVLWWQIEIKH